MTPFGEISLVKKIMVVHHYMVDVFTILLSSATIVYVFVHWTQVGSSRIEIQGKKDQ